MSSSSPNRVLVVIVGGAILVGAATAYRHFTTPAAPAPAPAPAAPDAGSLVVAHADAAVAPPPPPTASVVVAPDAAAVPAAAVDVNEDPWFVEHTSVERGVGECGGMEEVIHPRLRHAGTVDAGTPVIKELATIDSFCPHSSTTSVAEHGTFDFDGDGVSELMLVTETMGAEGVSASRSEIWSRTGNAIVPYAPADAAARAAGFSFAKMEDVDKDGRPDLLSRLDYDVVAYPPCGTGFVVPPMFLLHSLPNGDFSAKDAVAKQYLEKQCSVDPLDAQLRAADDLSELASVIVCARARGTAADVVKRALEKQCSSFSDNACDPTLDEDAGRHIACPKWALELAKRPAPIR